MIQRMVSCMFPTAYLYGQKVEVVTLVLSCQDAVSLTAAGHQLSRWDWTENTVRRLSLQACSSLCRETKLHHDTVGSKPCDQKDQKIKGWSSATSIHQRWWPENLMVCIEQGKKKKGLALYWARPEFKSCLHTLRGLRPQNLSAPVSLSRAISLPTLLGYSED